MNSEEKAYRATQLEQIEAIRKCNTVEQQKVHALLVLNNTLVDLVCHLRWPKNYAKER